MKEVIMKSLKFIRLHKDNGKLCAEFKSLFWQYLTEQSEHNPKLRVSPNPHYTLEDFWNKWFKSIIDIQGDNDRHLELCYDGETLVGFLYGKVDHENHKGFIKLGWGYVMEFYVRPEYRRKDYGRTMAGRLERLFTADGARVMYLNADAVTGEPFWSAIGFIETDEINTENNKPILVKAIEASKGVQPDLINFRVVDYPSPELFERVVASRWNGDPNAAFILWDTLCGGKWFSDSFSVIAETTDNQVVAYVSFSQNEQDSAKWYMANLGVLSTYRRRGIAAQLVKTGLMRLTDIAAKHLYSATEPSNTESIALHRSFGFAEIAAVPFNGFDLSGQIMFRIDVPSNLNATPMTLAHIPFVFGLLMSPRNQSALNPADLNYDEWKAAFEKTLADPDEVNFIIRRGIVPVAWLKLNGLSGDGMAWISMLVVHENYHHQGIGSYAISYAEDYVSEKGFSAMGIHANVENTPAVNCYKKAGYVITEEGDCTNGDGSRHRGYTFYKDHFDNTRVRMTTDNYSFSLATQEDIPAIVSIYRSLVGTPGCTWDYEYPSLETAEHDLARQELFVLKNSGGIVAVASAGDFGELADLSWKSQNPCELARIGVSPNMQNNGVGTKILRCVMEAMKTKGFDGIRMLVAKINHPALALYDKNGFKKCGEVFRFNHEYICYEIEFD
jgi:ribosomal protein S18 acetylase RimI-like enzyme